MFPRHFIDGVLGLKIKSLRERGLGSLSKLPLLGKPCRTPEIRGGARGFWFSASLSCRLQPQFVKAAVEEGDDPLVDDGALVLKDFPSRWNEKDKLGY